MQVQIGALMTVADRIVQLSKNTVIAYIGEDRYCVTNNEIIACTKQFSLMSGANCVIMYDEPDSRTIEMQFIRLDGKYITEKHTFNTDIGVFSKSVRRTDELIKLLEEVFINTTHAKKYISDAMVKDTGMGYLCGIYESAVQKGYKQIQVWIHGIKLQGILNTQEKRWTIHLNESRLLSIGDGMLKVVKEDSDFTERKATAGYIVSVDGERLTQEEYVNIKSLGHGLFEVDASEVREKHWMLEDERAVGVVKPKCIIYKEGYADIVVACLCDGATVVGDYILVSRTLNKDTWEKRFDLIYSPTHTFMNIGANSIKQDGQDSFVCSVKGKTIRVRNGKIERGIE